MRGNHVRCIEREKVSLLTRMGSKAAMVFAIAFCLNLTVPPCMGSNTCSDQSGTSLMEKNVQAEWNLYSNSACRFEIKYPPNWLVETERDALVASGAVVTFAPAYDPSLNALGSRTNLVSLSVTVSVTGPSGSMQAHTCCEGGSDPPSDVYTYRPQRTRFLRTVLSEGAVGNRYTTLALATRFGATRYEIILFIHSANPGCFPPGAVAAFDAGKIEQVFEAIMDTFQLIAPSTHDWIASE